MRRSVPILLTAAFTSLTLIALAPSPAFVFALDSKQITALVKEYCDEATTDERRTAIVTELRPAPTKTLSKTVLKSVKKEPTREKALELCGTLEIPGVFREAKKHVDSPAGGAAVRAIFTSGDRGAEDFLFKRWQKADVGSEEFEVVDAGFRTYFAGPKSLEEFHELLVKKGTPEERAAKIPGILQHQMNLTELETRGIRTNWKNLFAQFQLQNQPFPLKGEDFMRRDTWNLGHDEETRQLIHRIRGRFVLEPTANLRLEKISLQNCRIRVRVLLLDGNGPSVGVLMKGKTFAGAHAARGTWSAAKSISQRTTAAEENVWTEFLFSLSGSSLSVSVNGANLATTTDFGNRCYGLYFGAGQGKLLVGSAELLKN